MDISKIQLDDGVYNIKDSQARSDISNINDNIAELNIHKKFFKNRKFLLIGDSYADGYTPDGNVQSWETKFINYTGLTNTISKHLGGTGFVNLAQNKNFQSLLEEVSDDDTITDIVVLGGYNDTSYNESQIDNAINSFMIKANQKFPNAEVHIGFVGWSNVSNKLYGLNTCLTRYIKSSSRNGAHYINNIEYSLHEYFDSFASDGIHPNEHGQYMIAINLLEGLISGSSNVMLPYKSVSINFDSKINPNCDAFNTLATVMNNNIVEISSQNDRGIIPFTTPFSLTAGRNLSIYIGKITSGYIIGSSYNMLHIPVSFIIGCQEGFFRVSGKLRILNGDIYLTFEDVNDTHNNYRGFTDITQIQIQGFYGIFNSALC